MSSGQRTTTSTLSIITDRCLGTERGHRSFYNPRPAFRNAAASVAQLYDALHDAKTKDLLTATTDTGSGGYTHRFFQAAHSREDVIAQRDAIAAWARGHRCNPAPVPIRPRRRK